MKRGMANALSMISWTISNLTSMNGCAGRSGGWKNGGLIYRDQMPAT